MNLYPIPYHFSMKYSALILLSIFISFNGAKGQSKSTIAYKYPAFIISKVYELNSKIRLSEFSQHKLADYLLIQDSLAKVALKNGTLNPNSKFYQFSDEQLFALLSEGEFIEHLSCKYGKGSLIVIALNQAKNLLIDNTKLNTLLRAVCELGGTATSDSNQWQKWQEETLQRVLGPMKFKTLNEIYKSQDVAKNTAETIKKLKVAGLFQAVDSLKIGRLIWDYENKRRLLISSAITRQVNLDSINRYIALKKPLLLYRLDAFNGDLPESEFSEVIKYRQQAKLSNIQIDSILLSIIRVSALNKNYKYAASSLEKYSSAFEKRIITKLLDSAQLNDYLKARGKEIARLRTYNDWNEMLRFHLVSNSDSTKICGEIFDHYLRQYLITRKAYFSPNTKDDLLTEHYRAFRPASIIRLEMYKDELPPSEYSTALHYRQDLKLTEQQVNSLIASIKNLELLKRDYILHGAHPENISVKGQIEQLNSTLLPTQKDLLLSKKAEALANVKALKKYGRTTPGWFGKGTKQV